MKGPTLYRLAAERNYERIPPRCAQNPDDVAWTDHQGSTALHILCQATPLNRSLLLAVESIAKVAPALAGCMNYATFTPLHYAAEKRLVWDGEEAHGSTDLLLMLLKYNPSAVLIRIERGMKAGKTPFHISIEANADVRVLRAMLMICPDLATEPFVKRDFNSLAENPLQILWNNDGHHKSIANRDGRVRAASSFNKMGLLLRAAHYGAVDDNQSHEIRLVHAASAVRCPQDYFLHLLDEYPDQIHAVDDRNLLPLHYAVASASLDSQAYSQFVIESLLERHPPAASVPDGVGRLPLHVAVMDSKLTWHKGGIRELVYAYPAALRVCDPRHQLIPFLSSAFHAITSMHHLSTTYELLRAAPDVIECVDF